jgi:hypothetical protein
MTGCGSCITDVVCAVCLPGWQLYKDGSDITCTCGPEYYSTSENTVCSQCPTTALGCTTCGSACNGCPTCTATIWYTHDSQVYDGTSGGFAVQQLKYKSDGSKVFARAGNNTFEWSHTT